MAYLGSVLLTRRLVVQAHPPQWDVDQASQGFFVLEREGVPERDVGASLKSVSAQTVWLPGSANRTV